MYTYTHAHSLYVCIHIHVYTYIYIYIVYTAESLTAPRSLWSPPCYAVLTIYGPGSSITI